jgi:hypothetical protein
MAAVADTAVSRPLAVDPRDRQGEVYRARDTTLKRYVALKVLLTAFVRDRDRVAR